MRDVRTIVMHYSVCLPIYMERKQESSCGKKADDKIRTPGTRRKIEAPPTHPNQEEGSEMVSLSVRGCTDPKLNTCCCNAKDAVTVQ